jgi:hypothetical protein
MRAPGIGRASPPNLLPQKCRMLHMSKRSNAAWNKSIGIDPGFQISEKDREEIAAKFADGDSGGRYRHPLRITIVAISPAFMTFAIGGLTITHWQLPLWTGVILFAITVVLYLAGIVWMSRSYWGPLCRRELRSRGYNLCVHCGYDLSGHIPESGAEPAGERDCPECGRGVQ